MSDVPAPFTGASKWLLAAHASLAPQAADLADRQSEAGQNQYLRDELKFRRQLAGYLNRYRIEVGRLRREWEHRTERARQRNGISSPEFAEASKMTQLFVDLWQAADPRENHAEIKRLEAIV